MKKEKTHIIELLNKYITGEYTPEELEELLFSLNQENTDEFDKATRDSWETLLLLAQEPYAVPGQEGKWREEALRIVRTNSRQKKPHKYLHTWRIAATIALLVAISTGIYYFYPENIPADEASMYITAWAERGQKDEVKLPDESSVYLNSESRLEFPKTFSGGKREVRLSGEAFFDITPDSIHPFVVQTPGVTIEVIGTSFNVKNFESDEQLEVTVSTGKVAVLAAGNLILLTPDEQLIIHKKTGDFHKQHVTASKYSQWRKGILYFNRASIEEVVQVLQRRYNIPIVVEGNPQVAVSGEHDSQDLNTIMEVISFATGLKYRQTGDSLILYK